MDYSTISALLSPLLIVFMTSLMTSHAASVRACAAGEWRDTLSGVCITCSQCPVNEIVRRPCTPHADTQCGPFYEFEFFRQGGEEEEKVKDELNLFKMADVTRRAGEEELGRDVHETLRDDSYDVHTVRTLSEADAGWRELCYGLMAALVLLTLVFLVYVTATQLRMRTLTARVKVAALHEGQTEPIYCYTQKLSPEHSDTAHARHKPHSHAHKEATPTRSLGANQIASYPVPGSSHMSDAVMTSRFEEVEDSLVPFIPAGSATEGDHVRVVYAVKK